MDYVDEWHEEQVRAEGDGIEVEETLEASEPLDTACNKIATDAVRTYVTAQLDHLDNIWAGFGSISAPGLANGVLVHRRFLIDRDGNVDRHPQVSYDTLLSVTPNTVRATVRYEDDGHTCEHPVFLEDTVQYIE